jgi:ABC-type transport system involved in Fe-S cluster assembly fused permease/ATPase subunit
VLFNETIGHNIKYNKHDATHAEIVEAANESNFNPEVHKIE